MYSSPISDNKDKSTSRVGTQDSLGGKVDTGIPASKPSIDMSPRQPSLVKMAEPSPFLHMKCEECEEEEQIQMQPEVQNFKMVGNAEDDDDRSTIQPKLKIGAPGDKYEKEADAVADQVMQMPDSSGQEVPAAKCDKGVLQMKSDHVTDSYASTSLAGTIDRTKGQGQTLPDGIQHELSDKIGADFSQVKVHTDTQAIQMSEELGAKAFTHGSDIYFNKGQYSPGSSQGKHLLAHELTHTVQQSGKVNARVIQRVPLADFNSRHPGLIDEILDTSSDIDAFLQELDYSHSSVRNRTDTIRHNGLTYNLASINRGFSRVQQQYFLIDEAFFNERMNGQVNERLTFRWQQMAQRFIHSVNGIALAKYAYPLYPTGTITRREFPFALTAIHRKLASIGRHPFIQSHGTEIIEEVDRERAAAPAEPEERTTVSIAQTIRHVRQYIRQHLNDIIQEEENQQYSDRIYAQAITNLLRADLGTDSSRYLEFFRQLRSESRQMLTIIAFEGRLAGNLFHLGIEGLEEIGELRGEGVQFAYHMVLGSWNFDEATGEEYDSPNIALLFDVLVGLVPLVGQVADVRDITGYIYRMSKYDEQRSSWSTWLGLVGAIIGVIPALGDGAKSVMSGLRRGLSEMPVGRMSETIVATITRHIDRRYLELLVDSSDRLTRSLTVNWVVMQGHIINKWDQAITRYAPYMVRLTDLTSAQIAALRSVASERFPQILQDAGVLFRELIEALSRNISEELADLMIAIRSLHADGRLAIALEEFERMEREALEALRRGAVEEADEIMGDMRRVMGEDSDAAVVPGRETADGESAVPERRTAGESETEPRSRESEHGRGDEPDIPEYTRYSARDVREINEYMHLARRSTEPGYTIEIPLEEGHFWRRNERGVWCRFSDPVCSIEEDFNRTIDRELFGTDEDDLIEDILGEDPLIEGDIPIFTGIEGRRYPFQTGRSALRRTMPVPDWADASIRGGGWNAHHVIPWEFRRHSVFDILREHGGWDHNDILNGIALPTSEEIRRLHGLSLPTHQAASRATRGHGVYNERVERRLNELLDQFELDPARLRQELRAYIVELKADLSSGRLSILF